MMMLRKSIRQPMDKTPGVKVKGHMVKPNKKGEVTSRLTNLPNLELVEIITNDLSHVAEPSLSLRINKR